MNIGLILAGGSGSRMGRVERPKQFLDLGEKPVIIHTVQTFLLNNKIDYVCIVSPEEWVDYTRSILEKYDIVGDRILVTEGGSTRSESIKNGCLFLQNKFEGKDLVVVSHDSVRPFVSQRMISENIENAKKGIAVDTVISALDTIVVSSDGKTIDDIPNRAHYYQGQTPQTFYANEFLELYESVNADKRDSHTDACGLFKDMGRDVILVEGEQYNMKITTLFDLSLANEIVKVGTDA